MNRRRVMVAMSGGVDSSVAAAAMVDAGHEVVGVTLRLWGGESDSGCCSVSDVDDARRVAHQLGIDHHVFNLADDFTAQVVGPYVADHAAGRTPNPCIECNRHLKFDRLTRRAAALGFDAVATGHHARVVRDTDGTLRVARGADAAKDQSYVLYMLTASVLGQIEFPVGNLTKDEVRSAARELGLANATKPDSQDVCFITAAAGRRGFLADRIELHPGTLIDGDGNEVGTVDAVELVTTGQRRGLGLSGADGHRYAVAVDVPRRRVTVGGPDDLLVDSTTCSRLVWSPPKRGDHAVTGGDGPGRVEVFAQASAHGTPVPATVVPTGADTVEVRWAEPVRRVAPGQSIVFYRGDMVLGGGVVSDLASPNAD
jgi:tRNA-specific 2-thiouridylase